jgi:hypothetical protein
VWGSATMAVATVGAHVVWLRACCCSNRKNSSVLDSIREVQTTFSVGAIGPRSNKRCQNCVSSYAWAAFGAPRRSSTHAWRTREKGERVDREGEMV